MRRNRESGQALVMTALALTVLLGFCGLGIDMGMLRYQRRLQQTAADAGALAGASDAGGGYEAAADTAATANGFAPTSGYDEMSDCQASTADMGAICVDVDHPPDVGPHAGDPNYVQVRIAKVQPTYFMRILGVNRVVVVARAVAGMLDTGGGCLFAGATAPAVGVAISGNGTINAPNCPIVDNGDFDTGGNALNVTASSFGVSGSHVFTGGGGTLTCTSTPSACPQTGAPAGADPLSYLTPPTVGTPGTFNPANIQPGTYSSINLGNCTTSTGNGNGGGGNGNGNGNGGGSGGGGTTTYVFPSGTYIVSGGNFTIGNNTIVQGTGVTFYFTNGATICSSGTSQVQLAAPTTGTYAGILFYQDPNDASGPNLTGNSSTNCSSSSTAGTYFTGALYFPGAPLTFSGNNTLNACAQYTVVDAESVNLSGNPTLNLKSSPASFPGSANLGKAPVLVE